MRVMRLEDQRFHIASGIARKRQPGVDNLDFRVVADAETEHVGVWDACPFGEPSSGEILPYVQGCLVQDSVVREVPVHFVGHVHGNCGGSREKGDPDAESMVSEPEEGQ